MVLFAQATADSAIQSCVQTLGQFFAIILALALGEAFSQVVSDGEGEQRRLRWGRLPSLIAFIALVVPFFHGMCRYFFETYQGSTLPNPYWIHLTRDVIAFTIEAVLFFIMSRSLDLVLWPKFYLAVIVLLVVDIIWGFLNPDPNLWPWISVNIIFMVPITVCLFFFRKVKTPLIVAVFVALVLGRTVADYWSNSEYYFPPQSSPSSKGTSAMTKPIVYIASPYSKGDAAMNTHFQCRIFDQLLSDGKVWPIAPLWSHFQHTLFPRQYQDWIDYDQALLPLYDACLRLTAEIPDLQYKQVESSGADKEVATFLHLGKPVFYSVADLYKWVEADTGSTSMPAAKGLNGG